MLLVAVSAPLAQAASVSLMGNTGVHPIGIAIDSAGNIYTTNSDSDTVSKITSSGAAGGLWPAATGDKPVGIAIAGDGNLYVTNQLGQNVSRITPAGSPTTPFAATGITPGGLAISSSGDIFTANLNGIGGGVGSLTKVPAAGTATNPFATTGAGSSPSDVVVDTSGNVYSSNIAANATVAKFSAGGSAAGAPWPVSIGASANPYAIVIDASGNLYTANESPSTVSKITSSGVPAGGLWPVGIPVINPGSVQGKPQDLVLDSAGNIYTANTQSGSISKITAAGAASTLVSGAPLSAPSGITIDSAGNLYVSNYSDNKVLKITPAAGETAPAPPAIPAAPTAAAGDGIATVTITPNPADARYGTPSSYSVAAAQDPSKACLVIAPATSCEITGLANGTSYTFIARANLNAWQTASSSASAAVIPSVTPTPEPTPTPTPTPDATVKVASVKQKVSRKGAYITSRVTVSGAGKITQLATTGSRKLVTRCRVTRTTSAAESRTLKCNLGRKGRRALKKGSLKLTLRTTFTPTAGPSVTTDRKLTIKRRR